MSEKFDELVNIISKLRAPDGCKWDREQTHISLKQNFIEETYEALDAIDDNDMKHLREEYIIQESILKNLKRNIRSIIRKSIKIQLSM